MQLYQPNKNYNELSMTQQEATLFLARLAEILYRSQSGSRVSGGVNLTVDGDQISTLTITVDPTKNPKE